MPDHDELGRTARKQEVIQATAGDLLDAAAPVRGRPRLRGGGRDGHVLLPVDVFGAGLAVPDDPPGVADIPAGERNDGRDSDDRDGGHGGGQAGGYAATHAITISHIVIAEGGLDATTCTVHAR